MFLRYYPVSIEFFQCTNIVRRIMHRKIHLAFGIIWIIGVIAFAWLAIDAWHMTHIKLARYTFRIPANYNVSISGVNFQDVINHIAETQEQNTKMLEASIHTSY